MSSSTTALIIFVITYIGIIFTRLPKMNIDRPSAAFFGAVAMILTGILSFDEAIRAIDFNTIALLLGMMIVISTLQIDGFFSLLASKTISLAKNQIKLLILVTIITGFSSAFLVNDAVVLIFTPVIIAICTASAINPVPYLIAEILSSNAGSAMTITGNPQNMLIGLSSGITYARFLLHIMPVSVISMVLIIIIVRWMYPSQFKGRKEIVFHGTNFKYHYASMRYSVPIFAAIIVLFFFSHKFGISIPVIALMGGSMILIFGHIKPSRIIQGIDWVLLLFFASLFIVVKGIEKEGLIAQFLPEGTITGTIADMGMIHGVSLIASQVVSNVPFTVVMLPILQQAGSEMLWLSLASASTLAGNATIIGAMANLIVIESAESHKIKIGFMEFLKTGLICTILTMALSVLIFYIQIRMGFL